MSIFRIFWLLNYISIASIAAAIITPALPKIQQDFALAQGQVEWMVSAFLVGYVIGQLIYGPIANRFGRLFALRLGLSVNLIGVFLCFLGLYCNLYGLLIFGRLVSALGAASGLACTFMLINEWIPEQQRKAAIGSIILFFTFGIGLAVTLGGLVTEYYNWRYCFLILLGHGVLMLYGTKVFCETLIKPQSLNVPAILNAYKAVLSSKELVIYSLVVGVCSSIGYCFSAAGPLIVTQLFALSPASYGYWNGLNMLGMVSGGMLSKFLLERYKAEQLVLWGLVGTSLGLVSLLVMLYAKNASVLWFFSSTLVLYLFSSLLFAGGSYLASKSITDKASGSAMMSFINMATAVMAVLCLGYISSNPLVSFVTVLGGLLFIVVLAVKLALR